MNTQLVQTVIEAEGRYFSEDEQRRVREYALGMRDRLDRARRLEEREESLVDAVQLYMREHHPELVSQAEYGDKVARDIRLHLRYVALAHVNDDMGWFMAQYAEWIAEMIATFTDPKVLAGAYERLASAYDEVLDSMDSRELRAYTLAFVRELERQ